MAGGNDSVRLLEREGELERAGLSLGRSLGGEGEVLLVEGAAGIGKTTLLAEAGRFASALGARELTARATEIERDYPFGVVRQLLGPALREASGAEREALLAGAAALAGRVLEEEPAPEYRAPTPDAGFVSLHGLYWLLANLADRGALVLSIDDAHWADAPSLRFLAFLAPRLGGLPVAVAVARRVGVDGPGAAFLERVAVDPSTTLLRPRPLSREATATLLGSLLEGAVEPELVAAVHESVAGNPLYLRLLVEELRREGMASTRALADAVRRLGPESIARTILLRFGGMSAGAPKLARAVAVLGDGAELERAAELSDLGREQALTVADELSRVGILERDRLCFTHPVVRNALYQDIGERRRSEMHRRAARLLGEAGAGSERVASHLLAADPAGDPDVVARLRVAGRTALARGGCWGAVEYLRRALREPPPEAERAALLSELGAAAARAGASEAMDDLASAVAAADDPATHVLAAIELAQVLAYAGRIRDAVEVGGEALREAEDGEVGYRRAVEMLMLVLAETDASARPPVAELLRRAQEAATRLGTHCPRGLLAIVAFERALVSGGAEDVAELAARALADGRLLAEQGAEAPHPYIAAGALVVAGREQAARASLTGLLEHAAGRGSARGFAFASAMRAWTAVKLGALADAEADARACLNFAPGPGWELFQAIGLSALIDVLVERGELAAAEQKLARAGEIEELVPDSVFTQPLRESTARIALARRRGDEAALALQRCARWEDEWGAANASYLDWRSPAALNPAAVWNGRSGPEALAAEQVERVRRFGAPRQLGAAIRAQALTLGGGEEVEALREAVTTLEGSEARLEHARALVDLGAALRRAKHRREAREPLGQGQELAHRCGATALAGRAVEELRATGARPRSVVLTGVDSLTASERRVAGLAAEGLSNPEIAQSLFVTRKTVESHLRSVFRKLDISSRDELPSLLPVDPS